jgi:concanavalin A-like lectin/glucanase superfamily protein
MRAAWTLALVLALPVTLVAQIRVGPTAAPGPLAAYAMSNATDASGNGHTATLLNTTTVPGRYAEGQQFKGGDGSSRMSVPSITFTSAFTLEAWVKFTAFTRMVVGTRSPRDAPLYWQAIVYKAHDIVWLAEAGGFILGGFTPQGAAAADSLGLVSPAPITVNVFHHVALTYDGAALALVIDGQQVANRPATGMVQASTNPLEVGGSAIDAGGLQGVVDDVRIYGRALTLAEIGVDLATPVETVRDPVVSWTLDVYAHGAVDGQLGAPIASSGFPKTGAICNLAPTPPPEGPVRNPTTARVSDPEIAGRECEIVIESFVLALPVGAGYASTATAIGQTGSQSARSALSNTFDRVAVVVPPSPAGTPVVK